MYSRRIAHFTIEIALSRVVRPATNCTAAKDIAYRGYVARLQWFYRCNGGRTLRYAARARAAPVRLRSAAVGKFIMAVGSNGSGE